MIYTYDVEFIDEQTGESFITTREYDHEADWQEIWDDIVQTGDLQMIHRLAYIDGSDDED